MQTFWTSNLHDITDQKQMELRVKDARAVLTRLQGYLAADIDKIDAELITDAFMEKPNYRERVLKGLVRKQELRRIIRLIEV